MLAVYISFSYHSEFPLHFSVFSGVLDFMNTKALKNLCILFSFRLTHCIGSILDTEMSGVCHSQPVGEVPERPTGWRKACVVVVLVVLGYIAHSGIMW